MSTRPDAGTLRPWLRLIRTPGVGPVTARRLLELAGSPEALFERPAAFARQLGLSEAITAALSSVPPGVEIDLAWAAAAPDRHLLPRDHPAYPERLRQLPDAPMLLYALGDPDLLALPQVAVVGSRSATPQGLRDAETFAAQLAARGLTVTSGLALGVDGAAHRGALSVADGLTIAVCATGLDRVYPARHRELAREIAARGLLVTEFPIGVEPKAEFFPRRNRLIAGLSLGVLVVEAALGSGSLITARMALEQGREVFAVPGSIHNPQARGCHQLIRQGAKLVESVADVLEELAPQIGAALREAPLLPSAAAGDEPPLLKLMGAEALALEELLAVSGLDLPALSAALLALELEGRVVQGADGRYRALRG